MEPESVDSEAYSLASNQACSADRIRFKEDLLFIGAGEGKKESSSWDDLRNMVASLRNEVDDLKLCVFNVRKELKDLMVESLSTYFNEHIDSLIRTKLSERNRQSRIDQGYSHRHMHARDQRIASEKISKLSVFFIMGLDWAWSL